MSQIAHKLDLMRTKESWLHTEIQETLRVLKRLEDKMRIVARTYEVDKLRLHIQEIEKIISLIVSLTYRLIPVDTSLANMEWNGVEERFSEFDSNLMENFWLCQELKKCKCLSVYLCSTKLSRVLNLKISKMFSHQSLSSEPDRTTLLCLVMINILGMTLRGGGQNCWTSSRKLASSGEISSEGQAWWLGTFSKTSLSRYSLQVTRI